MSAVLLAFRVAAIAEACSWAGLLAGMFFKYVVVHTEAGVAFFGPVHGALFVVYVVAVLAAGSALRWSPQIILLGLAASIPPLLTPWFERRVARHHAPAAAV